MTAGARSARFSRMVFAGTGRTPGELRGLHLHDEPARRNSTSPGASCQKFFRVVRSRRLRRAHRNATRAATNRRLRWRTLRSRASLCRCEGVSSEPLDPSAAQRVDHRRCQDCSGQKFNAQSLIVVPPPAEGGASTRRPSSDRAARRSTSPASSRRARTRALARKSSRPWSEHAGRAGWFVLRWSRSDKAIGIGKRASHRPQLLVCFE